MNWYRKFAERGDAAAQNKLGERYSSGHGVLRDEAEAAKWYRKSAEQGNARAQYSLGYMYANDRGTDKDEAEAYKWYLLAAAQKDEGAKKEIEKLEPTLTPAQRKEGQRRTHEFKPSQPE